MRPTLDSPLQFLQGVGPRRAQALQSVGLHTVGDLLRYFPRRYLDRTRVSKISELVTGVEATLKGEIKAAGMMRGRRPRFEATLVDETGQITLLFFRQPKWFERSLKKGVIVACTGTPAIYGFELQLVHPEFEVLDACDEPLGPDRGRIVPIYPGSSELAGTRIESRFFRRLIEPLLAGDLPDQVPDLLPRTVCDELGLSLLPAALRQIHFPASLEAAETARRRFAFEELFVLQVMLAMRRQARAFSGKPHHYAPPDPSDGRLLESLPFALTADQHRVLSEIRDDLYRSQPMQRLLQGDVGAGKTVVAACALHLAVRSGYQAALMAPTEILAEQHHATLTRMLGPVGLSPELLTGSLPAASRRDIQARLADGSIALVVGTHALIQESVRFKQLALVVMDEQHRFGVRQRSMLASRGTSVDVLVMTATPIPRTLQLTLYGDLDVSSIRSLPPGRREVTTRVIKDGERGTLWRWLNDRIAKGDQAYVVYPIIDESEKQDLKAATAEFEMLRSSALPGKRVALLHGRTETGERRKIMEQFRGGTIDVLVATTVIEIGVDVANANIMVIEHAERFGLSQLHQLRGRVRRGSKRAYCIAVTPGAQAGTLERLTRFAQTEDGFAIAEADLQLRGPGDLTGARQSGMPILRVAEPVADFDLIEQARKLALAVCAEDPALAESGRAPLRHAVESALQLWAAG